MPKQIVEALVEGGKASAAPPLGPALGPLGVNIGQVISDINKKTVNFKGMQVPIKVEVDPESKEYEIKVGTPPASALIKKEAGVEKGSGNPLQDKIADLRIEQIIKIAKMKEDNLFGKTLKDRVKEVIGTCNSMGILVEGKPAKEAIVEVNEGKFDQEIKSEKTELTAEELKELEEEKNRLAEEAVKRREEFMSKGKAIVSSMTGKARGEIKAKLTQAGIPTLIIEELLPQETAAQAAGSAPGAAPAAGAKAPVAAEVKK
ncbi:MAG: 50S ribosomal protein L11 [Nanoarchaeota archaeon]|nr:MAG: 50S ribosomal protein L11 [Nanoarchaeota archaeon]